MNALILGMLITLPTAAVMADGCFCLVNPDGHFRHSCEMQQQGYQSVIHCLDDTGTSYRMDDLRGWTRLDAGQGRCNPCRQPLSATRSGAIRGQDSPPPAGNPPGDRTR